MKKIWFILLFILIFSYISATSLSDLKTYMNAEESIIYAVISNDFGKALIITHKTNIYSHNNLYGDVFFVFISNLNEIKIIDSYTINNYCTPVYNNEEYIVLDVQNMQTYLSDLVVYNCEKNIIEKFNTKYKYIGSVSVFENYLYYSTENSDFNNSRINLETKEVTKYPSFEDQRLAGGTFYIQDNKVLKKFGNNKYDLTEGSLVKTNIQIMGTVKEYILEDFTKGDFSEYMKLLTTYMLNENKE